MFSQYNNFPSNISKEVERKKFEDFNNVSFSRLRLFKPNMMYIFSCACCKHPGFSFSIIYIRCVSLIAFTIHG